MYFGGSSEKRRVSMRGSSQVTTREDLLKKARVERERHQIEKKMNTSASKIQKCFRRWLSKLKARDEQRREFDHIIKTSKLSCETCQILMRRLIIFYRGKLELDNTRLLILTKLLLRNASAANNVFMSHIDFDSKSTANTYQVKRYLLYCLELIDKWTGNVAAEENPFENENVILLFQAVLKFLDRDLFVNNSVYEEVCIYVARSIFVVIRKVLTTARNSKLLPYCSLLLSRFLTIQNKFISSLFGSYILSIPLIADEYLLTKTKIKNTLMNPQIFGSILVEFDGKDLPLGEKLPTNLYVIGNIASIATMYSQVGQPIPSAFVKALSILLNNDKVIEHIHHFQILTKSVDEALSNVIARLFDCVKNIDLTNIANMNFADLCQVYWVLIGNTDKKTDLINTLTYRTDFVAQCWNFLKSNLHLWKPDAQWNTNNIDKILFIFASCYNTMFVIQDDDEFFSSDKPLSKEDLIILSGQLKDLVFDMFWNGCSDIQLRKVLMQLLTHIYSRNSRKQFCPDDHFMLPSTVHIDFKSLSPYYDEHENDYMEIDDDENQITAVPLALQRVSALRSAMERRLPVVISANGAEESRVWSVLREIPYVIPFCKRVQIFQHFVDIDRERNGNRWLAAINIRRKYIFEDGYRYLASLGRELKNDVRVQFISEDGHLEAGIGQGVFKEFIIELSRVAFSTEYGLFLRTEDGTICPNPNSHLINENDYDHFKFLGLIMGKALYEKILVDIPFARFFLSKLLGRTNYLNDLKSLDKELHRNLMFLKNYHGTVEDLSLNFTVTVDEYGQSKTVNLIKDGANIPVTNQNKHLYIYRMAYYKLNTQIKRQSEAFQQGLSQIINTSWLQMFDENELFKLICGTEESDEVFSIEDMRKNTVYGEPYHDKHPTIENFWKAVESFSPTQKRQLLKFITSSPRPPLLGFQYLDQKIAIRMSSSDEGLDRLPTSSTCVNLLKLPNYKDYNTLREKLLKAIENPVVLN